MFSGLKSVEFELIYSLNDMRFPREDVHDSNVVMTRYSVVLTNYIL